MPPDEFENDAKERMYQVPLNGNAYMEDNKKVYLKLKEYLVETDGWAWIKTFDRSQDGQAAYQSWVNHYNGASKLDRCTQMAKAGNWTHSFTRMNAAYHSNHFLEKSNSVLQ